MTLIRVINLEYGYSILPLTSVLIDFQVQKDHPNDLINDCHHL